MFEFILLAENTPFAVALAIMFGIAALEGVATLLGFAFSNTLDALMPDLDVDIDIASEPSLDLHAELNAPSALYQLLDWMHIGRVPVLILLIVFLTGFGLSGLAMQSLVHGATGSLLPGAVISIPAFLVAFPIVRACGNLLSKIMPKDETDAISEESLIGHIATITLGTAKAGSPAEAKVRDIHGTTHYLMVEPDSDDVEFATGSSALLIQKKGAVFIAIDNPNPALVD